MIRRTEKVTDAVISAETINSTSARQTIPSLIKDIKTIRCTLCLVVCLLIFAGPRINAQAAESALPKDGVDRVCGMQAAAAPSMKTIDRRLATAIDDGNKEEKARLAVSALCAAPELAIGGSAKIDLAANAMNFLLDAGQIELASAINENYGDRDPPNLEHVEPSVLRFLSARARLFSFQDKNLEARQIRERIRDPLDRICGEFSTDALENRLRLANLEVELGQVQKALVDLHSIGQKQNKQVPFDSNLSGLIATSTALAHAVNGDEPQAISILRNLRANVVGKDGLDNRRSIEVDEEIASVLVRSEKVEEALTIESKVFLWRSTYLAKSSHDTLESLWLLGYIYVVNQRLDSARSVLLYLARQLEGDRKNWGQLFPNQVTSRLASIDARLGRFEPAMSSWEDVYRNDLRILGPYAADTQIEATNLSLAEINLGLAEEACELLSKTLNAQTQFRPHDLWAIQYTRIAYAACLIEGHNSKSIGEATKLLREVWMELDATGNTPTLHRLTALGMLARAELEGAHRLVAKRLLSEFVAQGEKYRKSLALGVKGRDTTLANWVEGRATTGLRILGYRDFALLCAEDGELDRALRISELARDRALGDLFSEQAWRRERVPGEARPALDRVLDRIQSLDERIASTPEIVDRVGLEAERTLAVEERTALERDIRARYGLAAPEASPPTLDALRARLDSDTALVTVMHSGETWWALVITRDGPARFLVLADPDLGLSAAAWTRRLRGDPVRVWRAEGGRLVVSDTAPPSSAGGYLSVDELGARVAGSLLRPIVEVVPGIRRIVFVGDDELVGVPLQALPLAAGTALDRFEITYAPSLATYARLQDGAPQRIYANDLLAVGAVEAPRVEHPETDNPIIAGVQYAEEHPLGHAREEIDGIAAQFPPERVTTWTGASANKAALAESSRSGELARYRFVHFATHAWAQPEQPEGSAIVLGGAPGVLPTQLALTAAELAGLRMGSSLVVLSACDTGSGRYEQGRGLLGLAYAGLAAGNRAELLTLWPVADDTSARFMRRFYQLLRSGQGPARALASTQREFRHSADARLADTSVWAPYVLYGSN